jgi:hypothetical protein
MILAEVADKVGHPSLAAAYVTGLAVGVAACGVTRSLWIGLVLAGIWLQLVALFTASCFTDPIGRAFADEMGSGYFANLMIAGALPAVVVVAFRKSQVKRRSHAVIEPPSARIRV